MNVLSCSIHGIEELKYIIIHTEKPTANIKNVIPIKIIIDSTVLFGLTDMTSDETAIKSIVMAAVRDEIKELHTKKQIHI